MNASDVLKRLFTDKVGYDQADPGDGGTIAPDRQFAVFNLESSGGAQTRTLVDPLFPGQWLGLHMRTDGGDIVVTADTAVNQNGDTVATFNDTGDFLLLVGVMKGTANVWRVVRADGVTGITALAGDALPLAGGVMSGALDMDGQELILDADGDTSVTADTDDQIDVNIAGADDFRFLANIFRALSGSVIETNTINETTSGSGVTIDGALVKDGGFTGEIISDLLSEETSGRGIKVDGAVVRDGLVHGVQVTPVAKTGVATIAIADILTGLVTLSHTTGATVALTLDTGTAMDAGMPASFGVDQFIDWSLINTSAAEADTGTLTAAATHTIVGAPIIQAAHANTGLLHGNMARFRSRRTATNTWVTYRIA